MSPSTISYKDVISKQVVENWGDDKGIDAEEIIAMHIQERFEAKAIRILEVTDEGEQLMLQIVTELWEKPKEFALLSTSSFAW